MSHKNPETKEKDVPVEARFSKAQILTSKRFTPHEKDFLRGLLHEGKQYTLSQAAEKLEKYLKQEAR